MEMDSKGVKQAGDPVLLHASAGESQQELDEARTQPEHTSPLSNQQPEPAFDQLFPFSMSHLVLKQDTTSINSFNALKFTTCNRTDAKNKEGCELCSCSREDGDSRSGLPPPERRDDATAGHHPRHQHPKAKLWHNATGQGHPRSTAPQTWVPTGCSLG